MPTEEPQEKAKPFDEKDLLRLHRQGAVPDDLPRLLATINLLRTAQGILAEQYVAAKAQITGFEQVITIVANKCGGKMAFSKADAMSIKRGTRLKRTYDEETEVLMVEVIEPGAALRLVEKHGG